MEYIIYCDESVSDGKYYTDFFGGVLVRNTDYDTIKAALDAKKVDLNLNGEIKWVKVTSNYFRETAQMPTGLSPEKIHNRYSNYSTSATPRQLLFQKTSGACHTDIGSSRRRSSGTSTKKAPLELHKPP